MMDKTKRADMLKALDLGQIQVPEAVERYGVSERHVRRMLSAYRAGKARSAPPEGVLAGVTPESIKASVKPPVPPPVMTGAAPTPPSMADIDKALAGQTTDGKPPAPDAPMTAELALHAVRMVKMMVILGASEAFGVLDEKAVMKLTAINPATETVIRMQKPEAFAALGSIASHPAALPVCVLADVAFSMFMLWKLRPVKEEPEEGTKSA